MTPERERRNAQRGPASAPRDVLYTILRLIAGHVRGFWGAIAAFLTVGMVAGLIAAAVFGVFAATVEGGFHDYSLLFFTEREHLCNN